MKIPKVEDGYKRAYYKCLSCKDVMYKDYIPYSLSNPIMTLPCGCLIVSHQSNHIESITRTEFYNKLKRKKK